MKTQIQLLGDVLSLECNALFVGVYQDQQLTPSAQQLDQASGGTILEVLKDEFKATVGSVLDLRKLSGVKAKRVVLVGLGKKEELSAKAMILAHEAISLHCTKAKIKSAVSVLLEEIPTDACPKYIARQAARATVNGTYVYTTSFGQENKPELSVFEEMTWCVPSADLELVKEGVSQGDAIAHGMMLTRELGNLPANICTPTFLGEKAKEMAKEHSSLQVDVLEKKQIEALKMGSFLSVAAGSDEPPRFIVFKYTPKTPSGKAPIVLVGKGVTFDTGGISLKPGQAMDEMKFDMCGAASVFGTFESIARLGLDREVVGLVVATENMPNGHATKPGDVITSMSGQTIEVLNTDAEGRLILCDALTYAERFNPEYVVDMATLTGACVVALGDVNCGLYSTDEELAQALYTAGQRTNDRAWRMPLDEEYHEQLKSNFADMQNIGGRAGGSITAACFLQKFTRKYKWAHLDIAGVAWYEGAKKGASGRPVPLLTEFLLKQE